jgi:hypothetical protein
MLIDLQQRDAETHKWEQVATFRYAHMAIKAAVTFSQLSLGTYRVIDRRFPAEGDEVTFISSGHIINIHVTPSA